MKKNIKILVIAAHPDDEVLGCGGSMSKWVNNGSDVNILILSEGATSRNAVRNRDNYKDELSDLSRDANKSAKILGVKSIQLFDLPDNRLDSLDLLDIVKIIENKINELKPEVIVTHHLADLNVDHQLIHKATITACRPMPNTCVKKILSFEVPSSTEWQSASNSNHFVPNYFEDISNTIKVKLKALKAYDSEMRKWPHSRSIKSVESLARWRGASVGLEAAEAFTIIREIT